MENDNDHHPGNKIVVVVVLTVALLLSTTFFKPYLMTFSIVKPHGSSMKAYCSLLRVAIASHCHSPNFWHVDVLKTAHFVSQLASTAAARTKERDYFQENGRSWHNSQCCK